MCFRVIRGPKVGQRKLTVLDDLNVVTNATGYTLFYAPYPDGYPVISIDMGLELGISVDLPLGSAFYVAAQAYNSDVTIHTMAEERQSEFSNIEHFELVGSSVPPTYKGSDYYPLSVGNTWIYNIGTVEVSDLTTTINGVTYKGVESTVVSCDEGGTYNLYMAHSEEGVVAPVPHFSEDLLIALPKEMKTGDSWISFLDDGGKFTHTFEGLEDISVPAGIFSDCLKIKVNLDDDYTDILWFAKNVGLVKAERIFETTPEGCYLYITSENPLAELQSATIDGLSYP